MSKLRYEGVPEVFGDGLDRAADSASFVTPQTFDVLPGFGFNDQTRCLFKE